MFGSVLPSRFYPDFLKKDLKVSTETCHPIAKALDQFAEQLATNAFTHTLDLTANSLPANRQRDILHHYGFHTNALTLNQLRSLFKACPSLFQKQNTLGAIEELAHIYFGESTAQMGLPYQTDTLQTAIRFPIALSSGAATKHLIFVRTLRSAPPCLTDEFALNCQLFLPDVFGVRVGGPIQAVPPAPSPFNLAKGFRLNPLRLTKLTKKGPGHVAFF